MKRNTVTFSLIICLALILFSNMYHHSLIRDVEQDTVEHARIAANPLWNFNNHLMDEYLHIILERYHYLSITVLESSGEIFSEVTRQDKSTVKRGLQMLGLTPERTIKVPVTKNDSRIGTLLVRWNDTTVYGVAYGMLVAVLLLIISIFYVHQLAVNKQLEDQVERIHKAMEEIRQQKEYIEDVFQVIPLALLTSDGEGQYTEHNDFFASMISHWTERTGMENIKIREHILNSLKESLAEHAQGKLLITLAEQPLHLEFSSAAVPSIKTIDKVIALRDITDMVAMEQQLSQTQKLEAVGQLAAGIAHEINTPTQYVLTNVDFFAETYEELSGFMESLTPVIGESDSDKQLKDMTDLQSAWDDLDWQYLAEEVPDALAQSKEGLRRIIKIVSAMKSFSRPASGEAELSDINSNIENTVTVAKNEWKYVADLEMDLAPDLPRIPCFPDALNQVVLNMIVNAAHAIADQLEISGEEKGRITIRTRLLDKQLEISLSDTGKGMSTAVCEKIFDPFFTTKEVGKGSGQGLAIARDVVVNKHHGSIDITSHPGKGSTFTILLPLEHETNEAEKT